MISQGASATISTTVIPLLQGTTERVITQAREDVACAILFLEETTGLRYYPVPTLLVNRYAITSVREHLTVDLEASDVEQKGRALALADVLNSICLGFHTHSFFPANKNMAQSDRDRIFGKDKVLSGAAFDLVRRKCEASVNEWVETYFEPRQRNWPRNDWQQTREDLLRYNLGAFRPDLDFASFISAFLHIVYNLLQTGLQQLGPFVHESGYTVKRGSWRLLQTEMPDLALSSKQSKYRNDSLHLRGTFKEFVRVFSIASERLVEALRQSARLASPRRRFFATEVPTYGIYAPPSSFPADTALSQWAFAHTIAAQLTLPHSPGVLLCLDACQRAQEQLGQEGASEPDRIELAVLFQRSVLVHEHFHALLEAGLDHHRPPALGTHPVEAWRAASGGNESLAVWMELHFARTIQRPDLMELVWSSIQAGSYPDWPYRGAEYLERLYQRRGGEPVCQLISSLRQTPEMAQTPFNTLKEAFFS